MDTPDAINNSLCPIKIFLPTLKRPIGGGASSYITQVTNLVSKLDQFSPAAKGFGMLNLQPLPFCLRQCLVIGNFHHDTGNLLPEFTHQFLLSGFCIFKRVMKYSCNQNSLIINTTFVGQYSSQTDRMIDVWRSRQVFATLVTVFVSGKRNSSE